MTNSNLTRQEYITQLEEKLNALPESERKNALNYYDSHIKESEDETAAIEKLGSPSDVAANILSSYVKRSSQAPPQPVAGAAYDAPPAKGTNWLLIVLLAIFGLPLIGLGFGAIGLTIGLGGGIFGIFIGGVSVLITGIASLVLSLPIFFQDPGFGLLASGLGLFFIGLGTLWVMLMVMLVKWLIQLIKGFTIKLGGRA